MKLTTQVKRDKNGAFCIKGIDQQKAALAMYLSNKGNNREANIVDIKTDDSIRYYGYSYGYYVVTHSSNSHNLPGKPLVMITCNGSLWCIHRVEDEFDLRKSVPSISIDQVVEKMKKIEAADKAWSEFSHIETDHDDMIRTDFLHFTKGTSKIDIWHWFEEKFDIYVINYLY